MGDAALGFLLQNLQQLVIHNGKLILGAEKQVESLSNDLKMLKGHLEDLTNKNRKEKAFKELLIRIENVIYDADDVVDLYITEAAAAAEKRFKSSVKYPVKLLEIAKKVQDISSEVQQLIHTGQDLAKTENTAAHKGDAQANNKVEPHVRKASEIVGFKDEEEKIIGCLKEQISDKRDVITIVGLPGQGKTTLAGMIFRNPEIEREFPTRIWLYISQEFNARSIFLQILRKLPKRKTDDVIEHKSDEELATIVADRLKEGHFLIVMDDVWSSNDWKRLAIALPSTGKVLVTSRQANVASCANPNRKHHQLRFLTNAESLELLKLEVSGIGEFPPALEPVGRRIAEKCQGLPLAIVIIGGILVDKFSRKDMHARKKEWEKVSGRVGAYLITSDSDSNAQSMANIIALSYDKLRYPLKICFLYLGVFPEDFEIPARKLTRMWMAQGFIPESDSFSYEETAESYLDELIDRNLLQCQKLGRDSKVKTCRIHDMLRDFCIAEGGKEKARRHCVHSKLEDFINSPTSHGPLVPHGLLVRSFVSFSTVVVPVSRGKASAILSPFKLLRVLESKPMIFPLFPSALYKLVHLRYITLSMAGVKTLPPGFSKLWNIQTLIVHTTSSTLVIEADIWEMIHLRHFETNASATLPKKVKNTSVTKLHTLRGVSPESCTEKVITEIQSVKTLSIRGQLALLLQGVKDVSFNHLSKLEELEKLKLLNHDASRKLPRLPPSKQFPPHMTSLTLLKTSLGWENMAILGELKLLEILVLKEKAFEGKIWNSVDGGFEALVILHIELIDFVQWTVSGHPFPCLTRLELKNCDKLKMVPIELADIPDFQVLNLNLCQSAAASAKKIKERKEETSQGKKQDGKKFSLSIFPRHDN